MYVYIINDSTHTHNIEFYKKTCSLIIIANKLELFLKVKENYNS